MVTNPAPTATAEKGEKMMALRRELITKFDVGWQQAVEERVVDVFGSKLYFTYLKEWIREGQPGPVYDWIITRPNLQTLYPRN